MKNSIKNIAIVASIVAIVFSAKAQSKNEIKQIQKSAYAAFKNQNYSEALVLFNKLDALSSDKIRYDYMIGMCLLSSENNHTALPYFRSAISHPSTSFVVNYYIGRSYILAGNYSEAGNYLKEYSTKLKEYMEETGFRFKLSPSDINDNNRIHMEKTLEDVNGLISMCSEKTSIISANAK